MNEEENREFAVMKLLLDKLNEVLCSYQGRHHKSVYMDVDSLALFADLLMRGEIKMQDYRYVYDPDIFENQAAVRIYQELAPQTRWRVGRCTHIEFIRINALKQFEPMGKPVYCGHIYYGDTHSILECGEILPYDIFHLFSDMPGLKNLYIFPYPYRDEDGKSSYYRFEVTDTAREEMRAYVDRIYDKLR